MMVAICQNHPPDRHSLYVLGFFYSEIEMSRKQWWHEIDKKKGRSHLDLEDLDWSRLDLEDLD